VYDAWAKEKVLLVEKMYRLIMNDFHKSFMEEYIHVASSIDIGTRVQLIGELAQGDYVLETDRFVYYHIYLIGMLARLDEATIQENIRGAFEFADSHPAPSIYMLE
jgi:hypothetical protein